MQSNISFNVVHVLVYNTVRSDSHSIIFRACFSRAKYNSNTWGYFVCMRPYSVRMHKGKIYIKVALLDLLFGMRFCPITDHNVQNALITTIEAIVTAITLYSLRSMWCRIHLVFVSVQEIKHGFISRNPFIRNPTWWKITKHLKLLQHFFLLNCRLFQCWLYMFLNTVFSLIHFPSGNSRPKYFLNTTCLPAWEPPPHSSEDHTLF